MPVDKTWSRQSKPHRHLYTGSRGEDVRTLQHALNLRLERRHLPTIGTDGEFGPETRHAWVEMAKAIGLDHRNCTLGNQVLMIHPERRNRRQRLKEAIWNRRHRVPLRVRALHVAQGLVGVMEQGGNNIGPMVSKIIRANGGIPGEPWCGDFVAWCYRVAGSKSVVRAWAAAWSMVNRILLLRRPQPGDIVEYTWQHTGILEKILPNGDLQVLEGNTGATGAATDSLKGGDGVGRRRRSQSQVKRYVRVRS